MERAWCGSSIGTAFALTFAPAHWKESIDEGGPARGLATLPGHAEAQDAVDDGYLHVAIPLACAHLLYLEAQSLKQGKSALDSAELIRAIKISLSEPAPVRAVLSTEALHATAIELLYGNAPFPSKIHFRDQVAE